jgi:hypothetical protein
MNGVFYDNFTSKTTKDDFWLERGMTGCESESL